MSKNEQSIGLSIVIPCFNEELGLPDLVDACHKASSDNEVEFILVDNGSTDGTSQILPKLIKGKPNLKLHRVEENQGYGFGILSGLRVAKGEFIGWTHADLQTDPADVKKALEAVSNLEENTFIKGKRYGRPVFDTFFTIGMSFFETILLRVPLWDINAQPTIFHRSFFDNWENPPHDFSLDLYAYYKAAIGNYKILRFPVYFGERKYGQSHWNIDFYSKIKFIKRTIDFSLKLKRHNL